VVSATRIAAAATVTVIAIAGAGCGGSSSAGSGTTTSAASTGGTSTTSNSAFAAFQQCLAARGVKVSGNLRSGAAAGAPPQNGQPPSSSGGASRLSGAQAKAFAACRSKLPAGAGGAGQPPAQTNPAIQKYTACLRSRGVTFGANNNGAKFRAATAACAKYAPSGG
jgi:hypothetical protein